MTRRYASRVDSTQADITRALRAIGATVVPLHMVGKGCPDLLVGFRGETILLEVKPPKGKRTIRKGEEGDAQRKFHETWRGGCLRIVHTPDEAIAVLNEPIDAVAVKFEI